ncbi:hypothetical protein KEM54_000425 [Ascosphaera aggregata]|nr:hypothetical protein KEM54_000425 [Ascosphaera aggregata]
MASGTVHDTSATSSSAASHDTSDQPATPLSAGAKRSRSPVSAASPVYQRSTPATSATKYYAVRVGRKPGIYYSWNDCRAQVSNYKGAKYKSFSSLVDADAFVKERQLLPAPLLSPGKSDSASKGGKFYGVRTGRKPGVYTDWSDAKAQIAGFKNPKFRKFDTREAAENFVKYGNPNGLPDSEGLQPRPSKNDQEEEVQPGEGPLPEGAVDGSEPNVVLDPMSGEIEYKTPEQLSKTNLLPKDDEDDILNIYTDGSSLANGRLGAQAGVGVYFGPGDERNVSEPLEGDRQTNQRAELTAILQALDIAPRSRDVKIYSDSQYSIKCVTVWFHKWRSNGWKNAANKPVENKDLITTIIDRIEERDSLGSKTIFEWVKGHNKNPGNEAADQLAVNGARRVLKVGENAEIPQSTQTHGGRHGLATAANYIPFANDSHFTAPRVNEALDSNENEE